MQAVRESLPRMVSQLQYLLHSLRSTWLRLVHLGVSSWVSTYSTDAIGNDWLQTGWKYYYWYSLPKQYVEWCIDCSGNQGTYEMQDEFANQDWGNTIDYWVSRQTGPRWCAYTEMIVRFCVDNLHDIPVEVLAKSEVHDSFWNPLDTVFNDVRYRDPSDEVWKLFDNQRVWVKDFPYDVQIFSDSYFRTYRIATEEVFLPLVIK